MAKPLYYRSSNPGLPGVTAKSNKLFEWDGTGSMPAEIANGKAFMPTEPISGEYLIMSDTYTLGYTNEADAAPIFFSDGGAGDAKILEIINSVANRLGVAHFTDVIAAKAWASSALQLAVGSGSTGGSTGSGSTAKAYDLYSLENLVNDEWLPGMMNYINSGVAGQAWPSATIIPVNVIDANGVNRQAELLAATSIKIYHNASNYVEFDVTSAVLNTFNGNTGAPNYDSDPNIVNTVVALTVTNPVAVGVAPSVANPTVTLLINGENPASGSGSGVVANAYYLNLDDVGGPVAFHNGMILGINGATGGPSAWPTIYQLRIAKFDAFGNDRQADFETATKIRIEADASNYVEYNVTYAYTNSPLFSNGSHPMLLFNVSGIASSAGQRPQDFEYSVDPGYVTVSNA